MSDIPSIISPNAQSLYLGVCRWCRAARWTGSSAGSSPLGPGRSPGHTLTCTPRQLVKLSICDFRSGKGVRNGFKYNFFYNKYQAWHFHFESQKIVIYAYCINSKFMFDQCILCNVQYTVSMHYNWPYGCSVTCWSRLLWMSISTLRRTPSTPSSVMRPRTSSS